MNERHVNIADGNSSTENVYKSDHPTYAQVVKTNFQQKVNSNAQNSLLGQPIQKNTQDPFSEFMKNRREILRRLNQLESQSQNPYRKW